MSDCLNGMRLQIACVLAVLVLGLAVVINATGCSKVVDTKQEEVLVKVVDEYSRGSYMLPMQAGKVTTWVTYPATHRITVEYDGVEFTINGEETYYKYKDQVGMIASATLETRTYDDGTVKYDIIALE